MNIREHYIELGKKTERILSATLSNSDLSLMSKNHSFISDYEKWLLVLKDRPEIDIFQNAVKEYQMALLSNNIGLYQQAFMGLRFFFERSLVAVLFSAKELDLNLWKMGDRDTYWAEITDNDNGLFSQKFCKAFFPELKDEIAHFKAISQKVYRECSEYVHGNKKVLGKIPSVLEYSEELLVEWNQKAEVINRVLLFVFCLRYLKALKEEGIKEISLSIQEEFKGINPIIDSING
jgi:hypothetical protein